jgi:hypothetical protein
LATEGLRLALPVERNCAVPDEARVESGVDFLDFVSPFARDIPNFGCGFPALNLFGELSFTAIPKEPRFRFEVLGTGTFPR